MDISMITVTLSTGLKKLISDNGKVLTKEGVYSTEVYLGAFDAQENWTEISDKDIPPPPDPDYDPLEELEALL